MSRVVCAVCNQMGRDAAALPGPSRIWISPVFMRVTAC